MVERSVPSTAPALVLATETGSTLLVPGRDYHVGRDPLSDVVIDDARVSWHHAVLRCRAGHWTVEDQHSTNGTYADGHRVHAWSVGPGSRHPLRQPVRRALRRPVLPSPVPGRAAVGRVDARGDRHLPAARRRPAAAVAHRAHRPRPRQRPGRRRPVRLAPARRTARPARRRLRDRRPGQPQRHVPQRPARGPRPGRAPATSSASATRRSAWSATSSRSTSTPARSPSTYRT